VFGDRFTPSDKGEIAFCNVLRYIGAAFRGQEIALRETVGSPLLLEKDRVGGFRRVRGHFF
jgi:hypothetical protein